MHHIRGFTNYERISPKFRQVGKWRRHAINPVFVVHAEILAHWRRQQWQTSWFELFALRLKLAQPSFPSREFTMAKAVPTGHWPNR